MIRSKCLGGLGHHVVVQIYQAEFPLRIHQVCADAHKCYHCEEQRQKNDCQKSYQESCFKFHWEASLCVVWYGRGFILVALERLYHTF